MKIKIVIVVFCCLIGFALGDIIYKVLDTASTVDKLKKYSLVAVPEGLDTKDCWYENFSSHITLKSEPDKDVYVFLCLKDREENDIRE